MHTDASPSSHTCIYVHITHINKTQLALILIVEGWIFATCLLKIFFPRKSIGKIVCISGIFLFLWKVKLTQCNKSFVVVVVF